MIAASGAEVEKFGMAPKTRKLGMATAGVALRITGIGPAPVTEELLARFELPVDSIDVIKLNEAFSDQVPTVLR